MDISPKEIQYTKKIGRLGDAPVYEIGSKGGLTMILVKNGNHGEFIGAGSHPAMAKYAAKKRKPNLELEELNKSYSDPSVFEPFLSEFENIVNSLNKKL